MKENERKGYIKAWNEHIDNMNALCWVHSNELSKEVKATLDKLKQLVEKVAEDKINGEEN